MARAIKKQELILDARLTIKLPATELKELKMIALKNDTTLSDFVRAAIEEHRKKLK
ncbi:ribbon-helix-helix protein, CopG family [Methylotenera versatilis]|uniref:ribbon-helix-helix protein, CopG family n=1 Tax=Methylotenera versatilis TaxID=1055487 RepID=UPI0009DD90D9